MVAVDVAMARSLRGSPWDAIKDAVIRSVAADLAKRDVEGKIEDVKTAFSSWDNCMNADFCKWPVIAVIAIGGLIILSIVWCIVRCCCCGLSCCCSCFECLKCCGNCCGCCDPPGGRKHKHLDDPYAPAPDHGYRNEAPMQAPGTRFDAQPTAPALSAMSATPATPATRPVRNEPPQYAEFEMSKSGNEDALPEMPSWESAGSKKVMVEEEAVELEDLKKTPISEKPAGVMNGTSTSPSQGRSPYGQPEGNHSGYLNANRAPDHYSPIDQGYGYNSNTGASEAYEMDAGTYGTGAAMGAGRRSPAQGYNDGYNANNNGYGANNSSNGYGVNNNSTGYGNANSNGYGNLNSNGYGNANNGYGNNTRNNGYGNMNNNGYGRDAYNQTPSNQGYGQSQTPAADYSNNYGNNYQRASPAAVPTYGTDARMRQSPAANPRRTPGPRQDPYGYGQTARKSPAPLNDYGYGQPPAPQQSAGMNRAFSPAPDRQYGAASPRPLAHPVPQRHYGGIEEPPQSPITNNSGFDFNSGYSRPPQSPSSPAEPYPGYKPYSPKP